MNKDEDCRCQCSGPCPNCGYCPCCGRDNGTTFVAPNIPYVPSGPYWPYVVNTCVNKENFE